ncbi:amylosucrase [Aliiglaciecola sp. 2_MG-2023]|uniref:amylosucrase n=1 Tax=unclassified Aliiglaciecola TaxID=2593648 RepID=UPI0026E45CCA|nr:MULTISPECIES: amylosucrase [unclassified Aliiglaciecola]MDO6710246.1 amylosucrase [Aliiglaciecola sp. 2_MG-2023]MDO6751394.1 amylosucrase [Aliiglaciecola sp. 1_MG-2023]
MNLEIESKRSLKRILDSIDLTSMSKADQQLFEQRLHNHFPKLFTLFLEIYGHRYDVFYYLQELIVCLAKGFGERSRALKQKDKQRLADPLWYKNENMLGMACYVDLFAQDLQDLQAKIPYLKSLGITYLHLMPLYDSPKGDSDGGYAVSDYRKVNQKLGTTKDLIALAKALNKEGISLVLDFVFNHTSDEHKWALAAKQGDPEFQDFYYMFDDRTIPDQYEHNLREIFPQVRRGNYTWNEDAQKWVWTTFNNFQWDLNYSNPAVFNGITSEMLFLANLGCEALRLDALAFIWKEMGTTCENQDKAHKLIQAFNSCLQISAPAVVFKSEAIVHPDEVLKYIDPEECQLSYNPLLMALLWNSLATRKTNLLTQSMQKSFSISPKCSWVNYVRCHDDIGWTFDDKVAEHLGIDGHNHRQFLNQFYTGRFDGSFAKGVAFGENPSTGDCRVCGSMASLAGLEQGIELNDQELIQNALARIQLINAVILSIGGIPLLYSGDEIGLLNDYSYRLDESKLHDARWVNRIALTEQAINDAQNPKSTSYTVSKELQNLIALRKNLPVLGDANTQILDNQNPHVFAYTRYSDEGEVLLAINNFSEHPQLIDSEILQQLDGSKYQDHISKNTLSHAQNGIQLAGYQVMWLTAK